MYILQRQGLPVPLLHIGYPKCLSSWLQRHLFQPTQGFQTLMDPYAVRLRLIDPPPFTFDPDPIGDFLQQQVGKLGVRQTRAVPVISSEGLSGNPFCGGYNAQENADRLAKTFPGAKVLVIVREQRAMIRSLHNTWLQWGMPHSLSRMLRPLRPRMAPQFGLHYLRFDALVSYYQRRFGRENVLVLPFELFPAQPRQFLQQIHLLCGMEPSAILDELPFAERANPSTSALNQRIQQFINATLVRSPFNYLGLLADTPQRNLARIRSGRRRSARLPRLLDARLERQQAALIRGYAVGEFASSNRRLEGLTVLSLEQYGYEC